MKTIINRKLLIPVVGILLFSACKVTNQYTMKDMDLPQDFILPDSVSQNLQDSILPWDHFFQDTLLKKLIQNAFKQNFDIRTADQEIAINNEYFKESKSAFLPKLNLGLLNIERDWSSHQSSDGVEDDWYDGKGKTPPKDMYIHTSSYSNIAALDWEVDIWGKLRNQKRAALAYYLQSYQARKALQTEVVATVAEDYYTLLMLDEQLKVAKANYHYRDSTLNMIKIQYNSAEVTALAVQQAQSQVLEAANLIPKLEREKTIQENKLKLLTGQLPGHIELESNLSNLDTSYQNVMEIPLYMVQNRPDVQVARYELKAANAQVGATQAAKYPSLNISLEGGTSSVLGKNWFNVPGALLGSVVGGLTAPILNGRELKTEFRVAQLQRKEAEIGFQHEVYKSIIDIKNALVSIKKLKEQLDIAEQQNKVSQKAVVSSRMLFRSGFATYLEVITAQGEALDSELNLAQARARLLTARIQLYRALGGGWDTDSTSEPDL